jgi:hypothetical protein
MHSGINECDYTLPLSSMSGKTDNLDTGVFCSLSSDNPFQTTLRCYSSSFRQYMVEYQTYTHACYRN